MNSYELYIPGRSWLEEPPVVEAKTGKQAISKYTEIPEKELKRSRNNDVQWSATKVTKRDYPPYGWVKIGNQTWYARYTTS